MLTGRITPVATIKAKMNVSPSVTAVTNISRTMAAEINPEVRINGVVHKTEDLVGRLISEGTVTARISEIGQTEGLPYYDGEYEVTPTIEAQSLPTKKKYLIEDVRVNKIPYYETSNVTGTTVYIGGNDG